MPTGNQRLGSLHRIRRPADFRRVYHNGHKVVAPSMVFWTLPSDLPLPRVGVVASKRRIGNAVRRNRARRLLREVWRQYRQGLPEVCDTVLIARPALLERSWGEVVEDFHHCARRCAVGTTHGDS